MIQQYHDLYLVVQTDDGLLFIDQHAAHERILYEQFKKEYLEKKKNINSIPLKKPLLLNIRLSEKSIIEQYKNELKQFGFQFTKDLTQITHIPNWIKDQNTTQELRLLLEELIDNARLPSLTAFTNRVIQFLACKNAVKAGDPLTKSESMKLIQKIS